MTKGEAFDISEALNNLAPLKREQRAYFSGLVQELADSLNREFSSHEATKFELEELKSARAGLAVLQLSVAALSGARDQLRDEVAQLKVDLAAAKAEASRAEHVNARLSDELQTRNKTYNMLADDNAATSAVMDKVRAEVFALYRADQTNPTVYVNKSWGSAKHILQLIDEHTLPAGDVDAYEESKRVVAAAPHPSSPAVVS